MFYRPSDGTMVGLDGDTIKPRAVRAVQGFQKKATKEPTECERLFMVLISPLIARTAKIGRPIRYVKQVVFYVTEGISFRSDFVFKKLKLIVEVDGPDHAKRDNLEKDAWRDRVLLETRGLRTLRVTNKEVRGNPHAVRLRVIDALLESAQGKQRACLFEYRDYIIREEADRQRAAT